MKCKKRFDKGIISTFLLIVLLGNCFFFGARQVRQVAEEYCRKNLDETLDQFVLEINRNMGLRRNQLELIADMLSEYENLSAEEARNRIASIQERGKISDLTILSPDNQVIFFKNGKYQKQKSILNFQEECLKIPYISRMVVSETNKEDKFIYQAVPIKKENQIEGILYEMIDLDSFPESYSTTAFGEKAQLYILDAQTGDFLMDTWHKELGNIYKAPMRDRKIKKGYNFDTWLQDIREGKETSLVCESSKAKENFYIYAKPVGINKWVAQITAPESEIFKSAIQIRRVLYGLIAINTLLLIVYFCLNILNVRRENEQREKRLKQTTYMYDVQKCLFEVYKDPNCMIDALHKTGAILTASATFLCLLESGEIEQIYRWIDEDVEEEEWTEEENIRNLFALVKKKIINGENVIFNFLMKEKENAEWSYQDMLKLHISSAMLVPIEDSFGHIVGVLGALNLRRNWREIQLLECVEWNFMMALNNIESYQIIQEMGTIDKITTLKNRNSYEQYLREYPDEKEKDFCCMYIDVDGLHELNNTLGHKAGDHMLAYVGQTIIQLFGRKNTYRIGGDEFVVFCESITEKEVHEKLEQMDQTLVERDYHVSVGTMWGDHVRPLEKLILSAEQNMYEAKQKYYEEKGAEKKARKLNTKLEKILSEKRDADMFLSIISTYFRGVYIVNIDKGNYRTIYASDCFTEALEKVKNNFLDAMLIYSEMMILKEDQEKFCQFIQADQMREMLDSGYTLSLVYRRIDGKNIELRVDRGNDYSKSNRETFWLFEEEEIDT